jgi:lipopolysaccharide/colanic/teichoic acid biosynthesis glycosyltransferase
MRSSGTRRRAAYTVKRALDFGLAAGGLVLTAPFWAVIALLIRRDSPGPVLFRTTRVGRAGRPFTMYKFRTMHVDAEAQLASLADRNLGGPYMIKIPDDPRVTRLGRILRRTSLDELPQLLNVLRGEMSLVGPRPQAPNEVALYTPHQRRRLAVLPGITGLWQVTARHSPSFDEWVRLDLAYIDGWSLGLDLRILVRTIGEIFR